jgi:hypothetical protein
MTHVERFAPRPWEKMTQGKRPGSGGAPGCACKLVPLRSRLNAQPSRGSVMKSAKPPVGGAACDWGTWAGGGGGGGAWTRVS